MTEDAMTGEQSESTPEQTESVLFVDDERSILSSIRRLIRPLKLNTFFADSGAEGLKILEENHIDLVVSDMRMPEMDGAEFLSQVKIRWPDTVRMLLTGYADISSTIDALNKGGIYRYISKPWDDEELKQIIQDGLKIKRLEREKFELVDLTKKQNEQLQDLNKNLEAKVEARTEEIRQTSGMLDMAYQELKESYDSFVIVFSNFINVRDTLKRAESQLVADLAKRMAKALKLKDEAVENVHHAGLLHQMGKVGLPDALLNIPEFEMSKADQQTYRQYPVVGETVLSAISGFEKTAQLIRSHTEFYDGSGYPDGTDGKKTRAGARILRVARDYIGYQTGIVSDPSLDAEEAFGRIKEAAGKLYDPVVVKCLAHFRKDYDVSSQYVDEIAVESRSLLPNMTLTRDLYNSRNLLLISKGSVLTDAMIARIMGMEKLEDAEFKIFVAKEKASVEEISENQA